MPRSKYLAALAGQRFRMPADGEGGDLPGGDAAGGGDQGDDQGGQDDQGQDGEGDKGGDQDDQSEGAPEKYEAFEMPEGMELNQQQIKAFEPVAKELNLTQEQAQKLVSLQAEMAQGQQKAAADAWSAQQEEWVSSIKSDDEMKDFTATSASAAKAINQFGTDEMRQMLNETGMGNHPELVRFAARVGKAISEDGFINPQGDTGGKDAPLHERMWNN
ncbi:hypothetical protein [Marinobacterium jannaschii]|uniref:hypothetical protein n=1 Tax=Marinobacterium jannaschii TaxID=64970 RepID=UPI000686E189|nr:hypothetical protein [Marinobacterium jannaschii]